MSEEKLKRDLARVTSERDEARRNEDCHYAQANKYSRYAECLQDALRKIEAVQYEGYGAGDDWKVIREIIGKIPHIDEVDK